MLKGAARAAPFSFRMSGGAAIGLIMRSHMNAAIDSEPVSPSLTRRRRTFLAPLWLLALGGILMLLGAMFYWNSATTTTIVLIRHAEKQLGAIDDAPLTPQGELRAARLAQMFGDAERIRPRAADLRERYPTLPADRRRPGAAAESQARHRGRRRAARLSSHAGCCAENRGGLAIIVGHSNTVPQLVAALSDVERRARDRRR